MPIRTEEGRILFGEVFSDENDQKEGTDAASGQDPDSDIREIR